MFLPRKLTFQLTPLLDLLLIIIFAQYMDVRDTQAESESAIRKEATAQVESLESQSEQDQKLIASTGLQVAELERELAATQEQIAQARQLQLDNMELKEALRRALEQQKLAGDLVAELFQVPQELVDNSLKPRTQSEAVRSPAETEKLRTAFKELAQQRGREVVRHLLTFEELRKRCDIWELYIEENGIIRFSTGKQKHSFRANTSDAFVGQLFARYKTLPQPKGLVIILVSYGDARAGTRQVVLEGLPKATDRMRADSNGRSRFEYAILGYTPDGPGSP